MPTATLSIHTFIDSQGIKRDINVHSHLARDQVFAISATQSARQALMEGKDPEEIITCNMFKITEDNGLQARQLAIEILGEEYYRYQLRDMVESQREAEALERAIALSLADLEPQMEAHQRGFAPVTPRSSKSWASKVNEKPNSASPFRW